MQIFRHEWLHQFLPKFWPLLFEEYFMEGFLEAVIDGGITYGWEFIDTILCSPSNSILLNYIIEVNGQESWNDNPETTRMMLKYCWVGSCVDIHANWVVWTKGSQSIAAECCQISPVKWIWPPLCFKSDSVFEARLSKLWTLNFDDCRIHTGVSSNPCFWWWWKMGMGNQKCIHFGQIPNLQLHQHCTRCWSCSVGRNGSKTAPQKFQCSFQVQCFEACCGERLAAHSPAIIEWVHLPFWLNPANIGSWALENEFL